LYAHYTPTVKLLQREISGNTEDRGYGATRRGAASPGSRRQRARVVDPRLRSAARPASL